MIYSSSEPYDEKLVTNTNYHISGTYILHKDCIPNIVNLYKIYLEKVDVHNIWTDQVILTHIYKDYPELFYKFADGYGSISLALFN